MANKTTQQAKRLSANVRNAKQNKADYRALPNKNFTKPPVPPNKGKGGFFMRYFGGDLVGGRPPQTVQHSIPYRAMYKDGICRVTDKLYTKTLSYQDLNYKLATNEDKNTIFEGWGDFLNYADSSVSVQLCFINQDTDIAELQQAIELPAHSDVLLPPSADVPETPSGNVPVLPKEAS